VEHVKLKQLMLMEDREGPQQVLLELSVGRRPSEIQTKPRCSCHIQSIYVAFCDFLLKW
jgi:hypothetical protein